MRNIVKKIIVIGCIIGVYGSNAFANEVASTPAIVDSNNEIIKGSINTVEDITLGGIKQRLIIRGENPEKPVLLMLHGGPGGPNTPFLKLFQTPELERNFIVVNWDQRGAGASYSNSLTEDDMALGNFISDTIALSEYLVKKFDQDKIFMLGHSWGSALGFMTINKRPELYHAYIAAGEAVDWNKRQVISFNWTLNKAKELNLAGAVSELSSLLPFVPSNDAHINLKNKWNYQFGGTFKDLEMYGKYTSYIGQGTEYTKADLKNMAAGREWSAKTIGITAVESGYSLFKDIPKVNVPLYFFVGRHDFQTPGSLVEEYFDFVKAPKKGLIWFENSAHGMIFAEPKKMAKELIKIQHSTIN